MLSKEFTEVHIGFTGTRHPLPEEQRKTLSRVLKPRRKNPVTLHFHHGCCINADEIAHRLAVAYGYKVHGHPPKDTKYMALLDCDTMAKPRNYLDRDHDIVNRSMSMIACPRTFVGELRSGTWATIRYARSRGIPVVIVWPDGTLGHD